MTISTITARRLGYQLLGFLQATFNVNNDNNIKDTADFEKSNEYKLIHDIITYFENQITSAKTIKQEKYLDIGIGILAPYLIHMEFEMLNLLTQIQFNKMLQQWLIVKDFNIKSFENTIEIFLSKIRQLYGILTS